MKKQYFLILLSTSSILFGAEKDDNAKHRAAIARLKEQHALEIALWEKKVEGMMAERDKTVALKAKRESASASNQEAVCVIPSVWIVEDKKSKK